MTNKILIILLSIAGAVLMSTTKLQAQSPGGITDIQIEYWLRADQVQAVLPADEADVTVWQDLSGNGRNFSNTESNPFFPMFMKSSMNFHSAVNFYYLDPEEGGPTLVNNRRRKLLSDNTFSPDVGRSYFVIWVSRLDQENSAPDAAVFGMNATSVTGNTNGNQYGWTISTANGGRLWHRTGGTEYTHNATERDYGIGIAVLPNNSSTTQQQFLNALASTTTMAGRALGVNASKSVIGTTATGTSYENYFFGEVMEIIVLSRSGTGNTLTADELKKINTHLAVKYGISLNAAQTDYILSDGTSIYNSASAGYTSYNNDIFGIARDDASGLYQKQSASTDNPSLTVYLGSTLAETNDENTAVLNDKSALMFGSNGQIGNTTYSYDVGTVFQNYTFQSHTDPVTGEITDEKLTSIFNNILRAKTTGQPSFTVNVRPDMGEWLLISADPAFVPATTRIYKIEDGKVENLIINDGDYIGFAFYLKAPGGVTNNLRMWLNASKENTITLNAAGEIINWVDYAGFGTTYFQRTATGSGAGAPLYLACDERTNYHPTPLFRKWQDALITNKAPYFVASPANTALYAVVNHDLASSDRTYFIGFGATTVQTNARRPSFGVFRGPGANSNRGYGRIGSTGLSNSSTFLFNSGATTIAGYHWQIGSRMTFEFDAYENTINHTYDNAVMNGPGMLGLGSSSNTYFLNGIMPEVIAYEGVLSQDDKNKINSYLGLKYALTIDLDKTSGATNFNFLISNGTSIWNGDDATHQNYHNNVASVIRDDDSELYNRQSKSTDVGAIVHMGVGSVLGCAPVLSDIVNDKSAITWGHNAGALTAYSFAGNPDICGALDSKLNGRIWLVDNTNFDQSIAVRAEGIDFPYNGSNWKVYMLVADDPAKITSNNWDQSIPMTYYEGGHQTNYVFSKKYTYISFAAEQLPNTCEGCEFSGSKKLEFTNANWAGGDLSNTYDLGDGFTAEVNTSIESPSVFVTNYPRASNFNSLSEYRRGGAGTNKMTTKVVLSKAAAATFEIYEIDRRDTKYSDVEVYGICGGSMVSPTLSYVDKASNSSYTIIGNHARANRLTTSYTAKRGRMFVEFEYPVEEIYVVHTYTGSAGAGYKKIGIGSMEFVCPQPLPDPTEDGLIFTKQGPDSILTCEEVNYTFRITNTNCAAYPVNFSDVLPAGMKWVSGSLSVNDTAVASSVINSYGGSNTLSISDLSVSGSSTLTFRASAVFDMGAPTGAYSNRANITYESVIDPGTNVSLQSCDRLTPGCEPTITNATEVTDRPEFLQLSEFRADIDCYKEDKVITVTVKINNPNSFAFSGSDMDISYNEEFSFVSGSLSYTAGSLGTIDTSEAGTIFAEGFTIPSGTSSITFKVKAPQKSALAYLKDADGNNILDEDGEPIVEPLNVSVNFGSASDDICLQTAISSLSGSFEIPYCLSKECVISNRNVTPIIKR